MLASFDFKGCIGRGSFLAWGAGALLLTLVWQVIVFPLFLLRFQDSLGARLGLAWLVLVAATNPGSWLLFSSMAKRWRDIGVEPWVAGSLMPLIVCFGFVVGARGASPAMVMAPVLLVYWSLLVLAPADLLSGPAQVRLPNSGPTGARALANVMPRLKIEPQPMIENGRMGPGLSSAYAAAVGILVMIVAWLISQFIVAAMAPQPYGAGAGWIMLFIALPMMLSGELAYLATQLWYLPLTFCATALVVVGARHLGGMASALAVAVVLSIAALHAARYFDPLHTFLFVHNQYRRDAKDPADIKADVVCAWIGVAAILLMNRKPRPLYS